MRVARILRLLFLAAFFAAWLPPLASAQGILPALEAGTGVETLPLDEPPDAPPPGDGHFFHGTVGLARGQLARLSVSFAAPLGGCPVGGILPCAVVGFVDAAGEPIADRAGNRVQRRFELQPGETQWLDLDAREVIRDDELRAQVRGVASFEKASPDDGSTDPCPGLTSTLEVVGILGGWTEILNYLSEPDDDISPHDKGRFLFGSVGLARGQVARLALSFPKPLAGCREGGIVPCATAGFVDAAGKPIADRAGNIVQRRLELRPGETRWLDLAAEDFLGDRELRRQVRALVTVKPPTGDASLPPCGTLVPTLEVFARKTGRTQVLHAKPRFEPDRPGTILFPSPEFATIQAAIDAVPEGGTLRIASGTFAVTEPLFVTGKRIAIEGAGCSDRAGDGATRLVGPRPSRVVPADEALGLVNYRNGGGGAIRSLEIAGFDACIFRDDRGAERLAAGGSLEVADVCLRDTARGILSFSGQALRVTGAKIQDCLWNGMSLDSLGFQSPLSVAHCYVSSAFNIGILLVGKPGECDVTPDITFDGVMVTGCKGGGLVALRSGFCIRDSGFIGNSITGMWIVQSAAIIRRCGVGLTAPTANGLFGIGIAIVADAFPSEATVRDCFIAFNGLAGIANWGSKLRLGDTLLSCNAFDLNGETHLGHHYQFENLGGNGCGWPEPTGACAVQSSGLAPPEPLTDP